MRRRDRASACLDPEVASSPVNEGGSSFTKGDSPSDDEDAKLDKRKKNKRWGFFGVGETDKVKPTGKAIAPVLVEGDKTPTDVLEVWFCGCHSDVGGGVVTNDTINSLANISLRWMVREAMTSSCDIKFDAHALKRANIELDLEPSVPELEMDAVDALEPDSRSAEALPALVVA